MGEIDAAGELVSGALLGRTVEPGAGEGQDHEPSGNCRNCGAVLTGPHCHQCGQAAHIHRSLGAIGHEIVHGVFHFEGKFWRTLPLLAWRPGELTRRYIAGERAKFVSPMAIYLFSIFAMFAVFSFAGISPPTDLDGVSSRPTAALEQARKKAVKERGEAVATQHDPKADADERADAARDFDQANREIAAIDAAAKDLGALRAGKEDAEFKDVHTGWYTLDHGIEKWQKNPALMLYKLQSSGYKFSWLLIPLSLPFLWLLFFWKRQYKLYDHAVFIIYSIAFMSLLFIVVTLAGAVGVPSGWLATASFVIPFVHITRQLQQAYRLRWRSAVLRAIVLSWFIAIILTLFLLILLALGMTG